MIEGYINAVSVCGPELSRLAAQPPNLPGNNRTHGEKRFRLRPAFSPPTNDAALAPRFGWR